MPLNINPPQMGGLAALASKQTPNLDLPVASLDVGAIDKGMAAGMFKAAELQKDYADQANQMAIHKMDNSATALVQQYIAEQQNLRLTREQLFTGTQNQLDRQATAEQKAAEIQQRQSEQKDTRDYRLGELGINQQNADTNVAQLNQKEIDDQRKNKLEQYKIELEAMSKLDDKELKATSAFNAATAVLLQMPDGPDKDKALAAHIDQGVIDGTISQQRANTLMRMNPTDLMIESLGGAMKGNMAAQMKDANALINPQKGKHITVTDPETGKVVYESVSPTEPVNTKVQSQIVDSKNSLNQIDNIAKEYSENYLTIGGRLKANFGKTSSWLGGAVPDFVREGLASAGMDPKEAEDFNTKRASFVSQLKGLSFQIMKSLSGVQYSDKQLAALMETVMDSSDDPSTFKGKINGLKTWMDTTLTAAQELAKNGIPVEKSDAYSAMLEGKVNELMYKNKDKETSRSLPDKFNSKEEFQSWWKSASDADRAAMKNKLSGA